MSILDDVLSLAFGRRPTGDPVEKYRKAQDEAYAYMLRMRAYEEAVKSGSVRKVNAVLSEPTHSEAN